MARTAPSEHPTMARLTELVQELLDAHCDTICLADGVEADPSWAGHLRYLQDLRRAGEAVLARVI